MIKKFEISEEILKELAKPLLAADLFEIQKETGYMNQSFANTYIVLKARNGIKIKYITDNMNQNIYCQIENFQFKYEIEDLFAVFNIPLKVEKEDFLKMIKDYSITVYENKDKIFCLFDEQHMDETFKKMSRFYNERLKANK